MGKFRQTLERRLEAILAESRRCNSKYASRLLGLECELSGNLRGSITVYLAERFLPFNDPERGAAGSNLTGRMPRADAA